MIRLLYSPSFILLQEELKSILATFSDSPIIEHVDGASVPIPEWLHETHSESLWTDHKVTVVSNAYFFGKLQGRSPLGKNQDDALLIQLLEDKNPPFDIIFTLQGEIDERLALSKLCKKNHSVQALPIPKMDGWPTFLSRWQSSLNIQLTPRAEKRLIQLTFPDLDRAYQEVMKISTYPSPIDESIISALVPRNLEDNVFELTNHLMKSDLAMAMQTWQDLRVNQVEPTMLIHLMGKHFQLFAKVRYRLQMKIDPTEISRELQLHEYRVRLMAQASKRFSLSSINRVIYSLADLDEQIKKGKQDKHEALSWWLLEFPQLIS